MASDYTKKCEEVPILLEKLQISVKLFIIQVVSYCVMDPEKIRREAKALMDRFMAALDTAEEIKEEVSIERSSVVRKAEKCELTEGFPSRLLKNAPQKKDSYVVAEKKKW